MKGSARVRLESAWRDWRSQKQSDAVIYVKADALRSALEEATRLGEVTDEEASLYRKVLESAPPSGRPLSGNPSEILAANQDRADGTDRTI